MIDFVENYNFDSRKKKILRENPDLKYEIENFIGEYDNLFSKEYCQKWIKVYDQANEKGFSYNRIEGFNYDPNGISDNAVDIKNTFFDDHSFKLECKEFIHKVWSVIYPLYLDKFAILNTYEAHKIYNVKIQKTVPSEGYHTWHSENGSRSTCNRLMAFILYLNNVKEGGETEFLYLNKRVKPKTGKFILFPSSYTHTHRGNPPINSEKYIITGWIEM